MLVSVWLSVLASVRAPQLTSVLTAPLSLVPSWVVAYVLPLPLLASERRRQDRRGRRLLLLLQGRAGGGAMKVSILRPPLASRLAAVPSSELASVLSAGLAYGPTWPWA